MHDHILHAHTITGKRLIAEGVFELSYSLVSDFIPGQIVALSTLSNDHSPRLYSICSGTEDRFTSVLFKVVPGGKLSGQLALLEPGDNIYSSLPFGKFFPSNDKAVWVAAGTGIAPFISLLRSQNPGNIVLIHGARDHASFYFSKFFSDKLGDNYIMCSSTIKDKPYYPGRVSSYLKSAGNLPLRNKYYLCGSAELVVEIRDILISRGIGFNSIESEIYF